MNNAQIEGQDQSQFNQIDSKEQLPENPSFKFIDRYVGNIAESDEDYDDEDVEQINDQNAPNQQ